MAEALGKRTSNAFDEDEIGSKTFATRKQT